LALPLLKLYVLPVRPDPSTGLRARLVPRPRLIERLNAGLSRKLTLVSAGGLWQDHAAERMGRSPVRYSSPA
jgi:hypothetical protein